MVGHHNQPSTTTDEQVELADLACCKPVCCHVITTGVSWCQNENDLVVKLARPCIGVVNIVNQLIEVGYGLILVRVWTSFCTRPNSTVSIVDEYFPWQ